MTDARKIAAKATVRDPRAASRARRVLAKEPRVTRGPRAGRPTRRARRAMTVVARVAADAAAGLRIGAARRALERFAKAGAMPHQPSGKHQKKLAARRAARKES